MWIELVNFKSPLDNPPLKFFYIEATNIEEAVEMFKRRFYYMGTESGYPYNLPWFQISAWNTFEEATAPRILEFGKLFPSRDDVKIIFSPYELYGQKQEVFSGRLIQFEL